MYEVLYTATNNGAFMSGSCIVRAEDLDSAEVVAMDTIPYTDVEIIAVMGI